MLRKLEFKVRFSPHYIQNRQHTFPRSNFPPCLPLGRRTYKRVGDLCARRECPSVPVELFLSTALARRTLSKSTAGAAGEIRTKSFDSKTSTNNGGIRADGET